MGCCLKQAATGRDALILCDFEDERLARYANSVKRKGCLLCEKEIISSLGLGRIQQ